VPNALSSLLSSGDWRPLGVPPESGVRHYCRRLADLPATAVRAKRRGNSRRSLFRKVTNPATDPKSFGVAALKFRGTAATTAGVASRKQRKRTRKFVARSVKSVTVGAHEQWRKRRELAVLAARKPVWPDEVVDLLKLAPRRSASFKRSTTSSGSRSGPTAPSGFRSRWSTF